jgi:acyl carrier protein
MDRPAAPVRTWSGGLTPPGPPAPRPAFFGIVPRVGRWGLRELIEPRLRILVADQLGVGPEDLASEVSLVDDLAADSLDLMEIALAVEAEFAVILPERLLDEIRTYGDLLETIGGLIPRPHQAHQAVDEADPGPVLARVIPAGSELAGLERAVILTPYVAQTIADDAARAGRGARLEIDVPADTNDLQMAAIQARFAGLDERGVEVRVQRQCFRAAPPTGGVSGFATANS